MYEHTCYDTQAIWNLMQTYSNRWLLLSRSGVQRLASMQAFVMHIAQHSDKTISTLLGYWSTLLQQNVVISTDANSINTHLKTYRTVDILCRANPSGKLTWQSLPFSSNRFFAEVPAEDGMKHQNLAGLVSCNATKWWCRNEAQQKLTWGAITP